ncbi:MAG: Amino acid synthesis [Rhodospirillaceae bacterium]|jgi:hypothetical protein|nr:Amino acid synthesis [Rhodospirillaceae bacterium]
MATRKLHFVKEIIFAEAGRAAPRPVSRIAAIAVIDNPLGGRVERDLSAFRYIGLKLSEYGRDRSEEMQTPAKSAMRQ